MRSLKLIAFLILFVSFSCEEESDDLTWYQYAQTRCADKWEASANSSDKELINAVATYLIDHTIQFKRIQVGYDASLAEGCKACFCLTGKLILVYTSMDNTTKISEIGFEATSK